MAAQGNGKTGIQQGVIEFRGARRRLVESLREKGVQDLAVLRALDTVPRHLFVPDALLHRAYEDSALPLGNGQTISQPFVHAISLQALQLEGDERVLEVGTGSGYQTALLSVLAAHVFSVERVPNLLERARQSLGRAGACNVSLMLGDGTLGWREQAPFDAIVVSAAADRVPEPLAEQLAEGGRLVIPMGSGDEQSLVLFQKLDGTLQRRDILSVRFVPLRGAFGNGAL